jgi:Ulp1 family protease
LYDYLFFPINYSGNHWCLVSVNVKNKVFAYIDSMAYNAVYAKATGENLVDMIL